MNTRPVLVVQQPARDGATLRDGDIRPTATVGPPSSPIGHDLFRSLAGSMLLGAALFGLVSPADANQSVPSVNIPCATAGISGIPYQPGVNCREMVVDGYTRRYLVWVPLANVPAGAPAVFMLHGASGTGEQFLRTSGWREKATQEGFIAIFPTAVEHFFLEKQRFSTRWNSYGLPVEIDPNQRPANYPATSPWPADDVKFIRQIGDDVIQQLATDPRRIFVAGFSNGAGMCARLGVEASDLIAAVACHGGSLNEVHETLVGHRNLSAYFSVGTKDDPALEVINSYYTALGQQGISELPLNPSLLDQIPPIKNRLLLNLDSFNLEAGPVDITTGATWTQLRAHTPQSGNLDMNEVFFTFLDDVKHEYPNGNNPVGFNLPDWIWPFFENNPRP